MTRLATLFGRVRLHFMGPVPEKPVLAVLFKVIPRHIVADNAIYLSNTEFVEFSNQGIEPVHAPPYHPSFNGQAECSMHTVITGY